jgi:glycosyltransferase involved in cell wall biosynthesis
MRIIYDHQRFCSQRYGGVTRYFTEVARHLASLPNLHVEIFAPFSVNEYLGDIPRIRRGIKIPHMPCVGWPLSVMNSVFAQFFLRTKTDVDIFHETYYSIIDCKPKSATRILTVFDMIHEKFPGDFSRLDNTRAAKRASVARAEHVICISENTRRDVIEILGIDESRTSVIHLGHALRNDAAKGAQSKAPSTPFILYVGGRAGYKNFSTLLMSFALSRLRHHFKLVCFGGGSPTATEKSMIFSLGLKLEQLEFLDGPDEILISLYRSATLLVYPSKYEGFGMPPLEAMALGCPVACSRTSSLPEVVGDSAELFDPENREEIVTALETIVFDDERRCKLIDGGYQRGQMFSWERCAKSTLEVYESVRRSRSVG